jgi:hypothetical protein
VRLFAAKISYKTTTDIMAGLVCRREDWSPPESAEDAKENEPVEAFASVSAHCALFRGKK